MEGQRKVWLWIQVFKESFKQSIIFGSWPLRHTLIRVEWQSNVHLIPSSQVC